MQKSTLLITIVVLSSLLGCGSTPKPRFATRDDGAVATSPLGPSYLLMPLPNDEVTLLGRVLPGPPEPGRAIEELARPNPCAEHLLPPQTSALASTFEDAQELAAGASARALLGTFGFSGDAEVATHFVYRLSTSRRVSQPDGREYEACCREKGCGYGYVAALIYGEGIYATGEEVRASGRVDFAFAEAAGTTQIRAIHKRNVRGYIAAVLRVTDTGAAANLTPFGLAKDIEIKEETASELVRREYDRGKITIVGSARGWAFQEGTGEAVSENEFIRRYHDVTGSDEIADADARRNWGTVIMAGIPVAIGLGQIAVGIASLPWLAPSDGAVCGELACSMTLAGGGFVTVGAPFLAYALLSDSSRDGEPSDHSLTELDARLLVGRYNRMLLRKTIRSVQRGQRETARRPVEASPSVSLRGLGLKGAF